MRNSLTLIPDSDPILHTKADPVTDIAAVKAVVDEMFCLMGSVGGIGLAAPQVGISKRFFIMNVNGVKVVAINPVILEETKERMLMIEGCLSYPGQKRTIERSSEIKVEYTDLEGRTKKTRFKGLKARCFLHEYDHIEGIVFLDRETNEGSENGTGRFP